MGGFLHLHLDERERRSNTIDLGSVRDEQHNPSQHRLRLYQHEVNSIFSPQLAPWSATIHQSTIIAIMQLRNGFKSPNIARGIVHIFDIREIKGKSLKARKTSDAPAGGVQNPSLLVTHAIAIVDKETLGILKRVERTQK